MRHSLKPINEETAVKQIVRLSKLVRNEETPTQDREVYAVEIGRIIGRFTYEGGLRILSRVKAIIAA